MAAGSRGSVSGQRRASGATQATEVAEQQGQELTEPISADLDTERMTRFDQLGFSRMRTEWAPEPGQMMQRIRSAVDGAVLRHFMDAYAVMSDLYDVVRQPVIDETTGAVQVDTFGRTVWLRSPTGAYVEDWTLLTYRQREDFLYRITTALFTWEQRAADLWGEAMFAKAVWQEQFATGYDRPVSGTIEDRTAVANIASAEDRYFAIFVSVMSRKADAVVRSMTLLSQRLKDTLDQ